MKFLRLPEVIERTGLSRSTIYRGIAEGWFPSPVKIGPRISAWPNTEIDALQRSKIAQRDGMEHECLPAAHEVMR
ncbi:MAG: helix-turn-helix transcriptional regulator [Geminicoccales bacterium]